MNTKNITRIAAAATLAAGIALTASVPAMASHGGGGRVVERNGQCSLGADWKIKAKVDNGQLEVEAEVDTNQSGQTFAWKLSDNGTLVEKGSSTTGGASGSFSVNRKIANLPGKDAIKFTAKNAANGETCVATVKF
jgi:hypothetical protein